MAAYFWTAGGSRSTWRKPTHTRGESKNSTQKQLSWDLNQGLPTLQLPAKKKKTNFIPQNLLSISKNFFFHLNNFVSFSQTVLFCMFVWFLLIFHVFILCDCGSSQQIHCFLVFCFVCLPFGCQFCLLNLVSLISVWSFLLLLNQLAFAHCCWKM